VRGPMAYCDDFQVRIRRPAEGVGPTGGMSKGNFRVLRRTERPGHQPPVVTGSFTVVYLACPCLLVPALDVEAGAQRESR